MAKEIQLFARTKDLKPTEPDRFLAPKAFNDKDEEQAYRTMTPNAKMYDCYILFLDSIKDMGIQYVIKIAGDGTIFDGNCRYWCALALKIEYVPVKVYPAHKREHFKKEKVIQTD